MELEAKNLRTSSATSEASPDLRSSSNDSKLSRSLAEVAGHSNPSGEVKAKTIQVTVHAGSAREFPISVFPGCTVDYSFSTKGGDISFAILLEQPDGALKPILEKQTVKSHIEPVSGKIELSKDPKDADLGTLWLQWDNTYSWFTNKELGYSVSRHPSISETISDSRTEEAEKNVKSLGEEIDEMEEEKVERKAQSDQNLEEIEATKDVKKDVPKVKFDESVKNAGKFEVNENEKSGLRLILGSMTFGDQVSASDAKKMIDLFVSDEIVRKNLVLNRVEIDTARMYQNGKTEIILGELLKIKISNKLTSPKTEIGNVSVDNIVGNYGQILSIATKANPFKGLGNNLRYENVLKQFDESLSALDVDSVDLFYLHAPDHQTDIVETLHAVQLLFMTGKIRNFGLSNFAAHEVVKIYYECLRRDFIRPTVYQGMYNVLTREVEKDLFKVLRELNIKFYAYNPLAGGLLAGKYDRNSSFNKTSNKVLSTSSRFGRKGYAEKYTERYWREEYFDAVEIMSQECAKRKISLVEGSLRWLYFHSQLKSGFNDGIILGASSVAQMQQNLKTLKNGPLELQTVEIFNDAWRLCANNCPEYAR